jgi:hypothetical protein
MNPEHAAMHTIDSNRRIDDIKKTVNLLLPLHERIHAAMEGIAINPEQLRDLYKDSVDHDHAYVEKRHAAFKETEHKQVIYGLTEGEVRKLAEILEYQIIRGINIGGWIPLCKAHKTCEYDDIANGVDLVLEHRNLQEDQTGYIGMGIDVSFSHNLTKKFQRIKDEIDAYDGKAHRLGRVKYFESKRMGFRGELSGMPRVVAALDTGIIEDLARQKNDRIGEHMARHEMILEMEHQLAVFADYAARTEKHECLEYIMRAQNFIRRVSLHLESNKYVQESGYGKNRKIKEAVEEGLSLFR